MKPFFKDLRRPAVIAHRGGAARWPENTLLAFENAMKLGVDMLELDVHLTRDEALVVAHDESVDRCTNGHGAVRDFRLSELQQLDAAAHHENFRNQGVCIPTLDEALRRFPSARLHIELKHSGPEAQFVELLKAHDAWHRVCIGSEHDEVADRLHQLAPEAAKFYPSQCALALGMQIWGGEPVQADSRFDVLSIPHRFQDQEVATATLVSRCAELGIPIFVWLVDNPREMRQLISNGVAGIMTDKPDVLIGVARP